MTYICADVYACMSVHTHVHVDVCVCLCMCACLCMYMVQYARVDVCICVLDYGGGKGMELFICVKRKDAHTWYKSGIFHSQTWKFGQRFRCSL